MACTRSSMVRLGTMLSVVDRDFIPLTLPNFILSCVRRSLPCFADPAAESPKNMVHKKHQKRKRKMTELLAYPQQYISLSRLCHDWNSQLTSQVGLCWLEGFFVEPYHGRPKCYEVVGSSREVGVRLCEEDDNIVEFNLLDLLFRSIKSTTQCVPLHFYTSYLGSCSRLSSPG